MTDLRSYLLTRRTALNLSRADVVRRVGRQHPGIKGITPTSLGAWESGVPGRSPSDIQLLAWADVLGCSVVVAPMAAAVQASA